MATRSIRTSLAVLFVAVLTVFGLMAAAPAQAHDQLESTNPKDGATLAKQPEFLTMNFSGNIQKTGTEIKVMHGGKDVSAGEITIKGTKVTSALPDDLGAGKYSVSWRAVSEDGHPVSGKFGFTIKDSGGGGGAVSQNGTGEAADQGGDDAGLGAVSGGAVDQNSENTSSGVSAPVIVLIAIGVVAVVAIVVLLFWRKSKGLGTDTK